MLFFITHPIGFCNVCAVRGKDVTANAEASSTERRNKVTTSAGFNKSVCKYIFNYSHTN